MILSSFDTRFTTSSASAYLQKSTTRTMEQSGLTRNFTMMYHNNPSSPRCASQIVYGTRSGNRAMFWSVLLNPLFCKANSPCSIGLILPTNKISVNPQAISFNDKFCLCFRAVNTDLLTRCPTLPTELNYVVILFSVCSFAEILLDSSHLILSCQMSVLECS